MEMVYLLVTFIIPCVFSPATALMALHGKLIC